MKKEIVGDDEILKSVYDIGEEERTINDLIIHHKKTLKMKQIINKLVKQNTKTNRDIGKIYYNVEVNEEK